MKQYRVTFDLNESQNKESLNLLKVFLKCIGEVEERYCSQPAPPPVRCRSMETFYQPFACRLQMLAPLRWLQSNLLGCLFRCCKH